MAEENKLNIFDVNNESDDIQESISNANKVTDEVVKKAAEKIAERRKEKLTVFLLTDGDFLAVRKRGEQALLKGLWEFPNVPGHLDQAQVLQQLDAWGIVVLDAAKGAEKKHIFTHVEWDMKSYLVACGNRPDGFVWTTKPALGQELALPSAFRPFYDALF